MSKIAKGIGKVFKKVAKVAIKVAPYALAAAAVVFTGGAALGVLPTFSAAVGGLVGGLGLGTAVTGALTGAITSAGFGGALGFITGGKKGLKAGTLAGALTGGLMGGLSPSTFGVGVPKPTGLLSAGGELSNTINGLSDVGTLGVPTSGMSGAGAQAASGARSIASAAGSTIASTAPVGGGVAAGTAAPQATGLLSFANQNPQLLSSVMGGLSQAFTPSPAEEAYKYGSKEEQDRSARAWGGTMSGKRGATIPGVYSSQPDPFGIGGGYGAPPNVQPSNYYTPPAGAQLGVRWEYDPTTNSVRQVGG